MNEKFTSYNIEDDQFPMKSEENDYKNLITRLKEIRKTIALFQKQYLDNI